MHTPTPEQIEEIRLYQHARSQSRFPISTPHVAFAGISGSYTEEAAVNFFNGDGHFTAHASFEDVFKSLTGGGADYGVVPIENSSTGSISAVFDLLSQYNCYIVGEEKIAIHHCLMAIPGTTIDNITEVFSHPQGFEQSQDYLSDHSDWKHVPLLNTAIAARRVADEHNLHFAAIASQRAATIHGLTILADGINTLDNNTTRFVIVANQMEKRPNTDKLSVAFHLPHRAGALYQLLGIFEHYDLNLCKIESRPLVDANWEYQFFLDFTGHGDDALMDKVITEVVNASESFHFLGRYASKK